MSARIDKDRQDFEQVLAKIRRHADLTDEAKRRRIAEAYEGAASRHRELVAEQERKAAENLGRLERGVVRLATRCTPTTGPSAWLMRPCGGAAPTS